MTLKMFCLDVTADEYVAVHRVMQSGQFVGGPWVQNLEAALERHLCVSDRTVITCNSGTDALWLAIESLCPIPRSEVIVPAMTFQASAEAVVRAGAIPVVVDCLPGDPAPDPAAVAAAITPRTIAVMVVHMYGWPASTTVAVRDLCRARGLAMIEDCAQAFGATLNGIPVGSLGDAAAFSFYPTKPLGGIGDGGAVVVRAQEGDQTRALANHGRGHPQGEQAFPGHNSRLDAVQAAVLSERLERYPRTLRILRDLAEAYWTATGGRRWPLLAPRAGVRPAPYVWPISPPPALRGEIQARLRGLGIETGIYYGRPINELPWCRADCPNASALARSILCLPLHRGMTAEDVGQVEAALAAAGI